MAAAVAVSISLSSSGHHPGLRPRPTSRAHPIYHSLLGGQTAERCRRRRLTVLAAAGKKPGEAEEQIPAWAKPGADEPPPWAREGGAVQGQEAGQVPFYAYLLASAITAIAAVRFLETPPFPLSLLAMRSLLIEAWLGIFFTDKIAPQIGSIFEYTNQRPVFGIIGSDSALYAPLLGFFVFTGIPTSGFLWFKAVQTANREAEEQDRRDGFL
ncbi:hypothetical protein HU200_024123 [Digitaria exilis]|uniref:Uncharacterized protein n=1 Tax=Digitaria exilis TaxID=1010633 RepID=A0A835C135_9POAL|nr:hypothetical protein HU200_024123 [Digitaria exilis]